MSKEKVGVLGMVRYLLFFCVIAFGFITIVATGGGGGGGVTGGASGTLSVRLTDASTDEYQAVYVTIDEVQVHMPDGEWEVVGSPMQTYNLLDLVNGMIEDLALTELEAGDYTQMRLILGNNPNGHDGGTNILGETHPFANYIIDTEDPPNVEPLKTPSAQQSGIKIVHGFTISDGGITELVLDFDAQKSVAVSNHGEVQPDKRTYILKPTIKVIDTEVSSATVSGTVTEEAVNGDDPIFLEGVTVSAQFYNNEDKLLIQASTVTNQDGQYKMILDENVSYYNIVAYKDSYYPACINNVVLATGDNLTDQDFTLSVAETGTVSGSVEIENGSAEDSAILSFRQECGGDTIQVKSVNVVNGDTYGGIDNEVTLPVGAYTGVASTDMADPDVDERADQEITDGGVSIFEVAVDADTELDDIIFPEPAP